VFEYEIRRNCFPLVLRCKKTGKEHVLSGSLEVALAEIILSVGSKISHLENENRHLREKIDNLEVKIKELNEKNI
jgi:hypothetical protein